MLCINKEEIVARQTSGLGSTDFFIGYMSISKEEKRWKELNTMQISANIFYIIWNFRIFRDFPFSY